MKNLEYISTLILSIIYGVLLSIIYLMFALVIFFICVGYFGWDDFAEILSNTYIYYLPICILLTSLVLKQYKEFCVILIAICSELYILHLWIEYWENVRWNIF
jgi:hypothetical protein